MRVSAASHHVAKAIASCRLIKYAAADVTYLHHMHRAWRVFVGEKKMAAVTERRMRERIESPEGLEQGTEAAKRRGSRREKFF